MRRKKFAPLSSSHVLLSNKKMKKNSCFFFRVVPGESPQHLDRQFRHDGNEQVEQRGRYRQQRRRFGHGDIIFPVFSLYFSFRFAKKKKTAQPLLPHHSHFSLFSSATPLTLKKIPCFSQDSFWRAFRGSAFIDGKAGLLCLRRRLERERAQSKERHDEKKRGLLTHFFLPLSLSLSLFSLSHSFFLQLATAQTLNSSVPVGSQRPSRLPAPSA